MRLEQTLEELDAGIFLKKLDAQIKNVALGVAEYGRNGEVVIKLKLKSQGGGRVLLTHSIDSLKPTLRGKAREDDTTTTEMHVNKDGSLSIAPERQADWTKSEKVTSISGN